MWAPPRAETRQGRFATFDAFRAHSQLRLQSPDKQLRPGRQRLQPIRSTQAVHRDGRETARRRQPSLDGGSRHAPPCQQNQHQVVEYEVGTQTAGILRPSGQSGQEPQQLGPVSCEVDGIGEVGRERLDERVIAGIELADADDHTSKTPPRIRIGGPCHDDPPTLPQLVVEGRPDEILLGREAAVEGCGTNAGSSCDLAHRDREALFSEQTPGRFQESIAVVESVRPQQARQRIRHVPHFTQVDGGVR